MCGIFGIISQKQKPIIHRVLDGLNRLEHRGKAAAGFITVNTKSKRFDDIIRRVGAASETFRDLNLDKIVGDAAIGHTRYPTSGGTNNQTQPMYTNNPGIAIAHNGQLLNHVQLREKLQEETFYDPVSDSDSEVLLHALAQNLRGTGSYHGKDTRTFVDDHLFPALEKLMELDNGFSTVGAYSVVALIPGYGLLGFTDPFGRRPLFLADYESGHDKGKAFASETIALDTLKGYKNREELGAGEAVLLGFDRKVYKKNILDLGVKKCLVERVYFGQPYSQFGGISNEEHREALARALLKKYASLRDKIDVITPVPRAPTSAAIEAARLWDKPYGGIDAVGKGRTFQEMNAEARQDAATQKFTYNERKINGKRIGVIDDTVIRGTNSRTVIDRLYKLGAEEVHFFVTYPPFIGICPFGIDIPNQEDLLFVNRDLEQARTFIGATTLNYLSLNETLEALQLNRNNSCLGCTEKDYGGLDLSQYAAFQTNRSGLPVIH